MRFPRGTAPLAALAAFLTTIHPALAADPAAKPIRALLICGGCCHDYEAQKDTIARGLAERANIDVTVVHQGGSTTDARIPFYEKEGWADGFDVVLHDECFAEVKDPSWTERVLKPHKAGLPAVVIHCAMHSYRDGTDEWFQFCGVTSRGHGAAYPHEVLNVDAKHPVMKGFGPAWANPAGELYAIEKVWPTAHPLGTAKNRENGRDETCVWANQYGKARVFGTTLGHHNETVGHPAFLDLLTRGTLWACNALDDDHLKPATATRQPVDAARGKAATASSEEKGKGNVAGLAVDGDPSTRWCASSADAPQWWQVDLGAPTNLTGIRLDWESPSDAYKHKVEGSADGKAWKILADASGNTQAGSNRHGFAASGIRHVRVTFLGSSGGAWGSLVEVKVFSDQTAAVDPRAARSAAEEATLGEVKVPEGYDLTLFAAPPAVNYPIFVSAAPNGDVYVSSDKNGSIDREPHRGSVLRLRDVDGDGRADEVRRFISDVDSPRGLVWDRDRLYLLHPPDLSVYLDRDGDGVADEEKVLVKGIGFGYKDRPGDHTSNGVTLGIDGWLHLAIGDFGFLKAEGTDGRTLQLRGGGVVRVRTDGTGLELFSRGTRNILEVGLDPFLNGFARDNTNDGDGWDIRLHHFSGMEEHGYPSLYKNFPDEAVAPLADYGGGSGCGSLFLSEPGFPNGDGQALYTADWGRNNVFRHHLKPKGATFTADESPFLNIPRVTDLDVDASGHLYATSMRGATFTYEGENVGFLARVTPKGTKAEALPDYEHLDRAELVAALASPSHRRRLEAQRTLLGRGLDDASADKLRAFAFDGHKPLSGRVAALFALKQGLGAKSHPALIALAGDASLREFDFRALADQPDGTADFPDDLGLLALRDPNPRTRLQALQAIARLGKAQHASAVAALLGDDDPIVAHTAIKALVALDASATCFAVLDDAGAPAPARPGALRVLQALHQPEVADGLIRRLDREENPGRRRGLLAALCRLHAREGRWKGDGWGTRPDSSGPYYQPETWEASSKIAAALKSVLERGSGEEAGFLLTELGRNKVRLDGGLDRAIALAEKDPALLPAVVGRLAEADALPAGGVALLIRASGSKGLAPGVRARAIPALAKIGGDDEFRAILHALASLNRDEQAKAGRDSFLKSPKLGERHDLFEEEAARLDGSSSAWAEAALLTLSTNAGASPEAREAARKAIDAGWSIPARRAQILKAAALANHRASADRILDALSDPDKAVAAAAKAAADELKIVREAASAGPKIDAIGRDAALLALDKAKGDPARGERLFQRIGCVNCHAIRADEPPRGPFLGTIANTYSRHDLAEAVLRPGKSIAQGFVANTLALDDGRTITGFVTAEAADAVTLRTIDGKEARIPTDRIEDRVRQEISLMPEGLVDGLTVEEFASLIDYLVSLPRK